MYLIPDFKKEIDSQIKKVALETLKIDVKIKFSESDKDLSVYIWYANEYDSIATFTISAMPGCCGIAVSNGVKMEEWCRNRGFGKALHKIRMYIIKRMGYSCVICTDITGNIPQERILYKNNWVRVNSFKNSRTGNNVSVFVHNFSKATVLSWLNRLNFRRWNMFNHCVKEPEDSLWGPDNHK